MRLWRDWLLQLAGAACAMTLASAVGGCSYQLDSLFSKKIDSAAGTTSSVRSAMEPKVATELPPEHDLAIARAAVSEVLSKGGEDTSMPWENPSTGARGTITPIATAYAQDGLTCRDFLASYVRNGSESWMQGEACRAGKGRWQVRHMKPWQRT